MHPTFIEVTSTILFALAILHTFSVTYFQKLAHQYPSGSVGENLFHLLGEVEAVFGLWSGIFFLVFVFGGAPHLAIEYVEGLNFTEPLFVFAIMTIASTRPIIEFAGKIIASVAKILPLHESISYYFCCMTVGTLLGSLITEPAAITVCAILLYERFFKQSVSQRFRYFTLALLFVNISIGGTLTHFAAPPVVMVAGKWGWDFSFMFSHFGWKSVIAVFINASVFSFILSRELKLIPKLESRESRKNPMALPRWITGLHLLFLVLVVATAHYSNVFMGIFLFFLGVATITREYQTPLKLRESLLVAFFLGGLVVFGGLQRWWLEPLLASLGDVTLFLSATGLTAMTDNAALTYLGSQVPGLSEGAKFGLVAGAVAGGGLTIIANAPNPVGYSILKPSFGDQGLNAVQLLKAAIFPTLVAMICLWFLPNF